MTQAIKKLNITVTVDDEQAEQLKNLVYSVDDNATIEEYEVVYSCEHGGDYTAEDVKSEIRNWISVTLPFRIMEPHQKEQVVETVYPMVLERLTWQCPLTLLLEFDQDDLADVLERYQAAHGKIVFSKEQVVKYLEARGYNLDHLVADRNYFWDIVREYFKYDEQNNEFTLAG